MVRTLLLIILFLALLGSLPLWSYSSGWGYYPTGGFSILIIVILLIMFRGRSKV